MEAKKYVILPNMIERKKVYGITSTSIGIKSIHLITKYRVIMKERQKVNAYYTAKSFLGDSLGFILTINCGLII